MEAKGFDREAYGHWLKLGRPSDDGPHREQGDIDANPPSSDDLFLIKLEGYLSTPQRLQEIAKLTEEPHTDVGISDHGNNTLFCRIDGNARRCVE